MNALFLQRIVPAFVAAAALAAPMRAAAAEPAYNTVGAGGYDLVSYHTGEKPLRGNGNHTVVYDGVTYLFVNEDNRGTFERSPAKYLPAYGGYCAYGVSIGKKFVADPDVWDIVDGRLYLNLDNNVKGVWSKDIPKNIAKAEAIWPQIEDKHPSQL